MPYLNPMIGPFYVKGAEKGDSILKILRGDTNEWHS
jgi:acetamidase/formamidase